MITPCEDYKEVHLPARTNEKPCRFIRLVMIARDDVRSAYCVNIRNLLQLSEKSSTIISGYKPKKGRGTRIELFCCEKDIFHEATLFPSVMILTAGGTATPVA